MTPTEVRVAWDRTVCPVYEKNERHRSYKTEDDGKRHLVWLFKKSGPDLFNKALDEFFDAGVNCLQPKLPELLKTPEPLKDVFGNPLPNPYTTGDIEGQTILVQHDLKLASFYKSLAESPWRTWKAWRDENAQIGEIRRFRYNSEVHAVNPCANPKATKTELAKFEREHPDWMVKRCRWESQPITFPFKDTKNFNLTIYGKIGRNPIIGPLFAEMEQLETRYVTKAKMDAQRQLADAEAQLKKLHTGFATIGAVT